MERRFFFCTTTDTNVSYHLVARCFQWGAGKNFYRKIAEERKREKNFFSGFRPSALQRCGFNFVIVDRGKTRGVRVQPIAPLDQNFANQPKNPVTFAQCSYVWLHV